MKCVFFSCYMTRASSLTKFWLLCSLLNVGTHVPSYCNLLEFIYPLDSSLLLIDIYILYIYTCNIYYICIYYIWVLLTQTIDFYTFTFFSHVIRKVSLLCVAYIGSSWKVHFFYSSHFIILCMRVLFCLLARCEMSHFRAHKWSQTHSNPPVLVSLLVRFLEWRSTPGFISLYLLIEEF